MRPEPRRLATLVDAREVQEIGEAILAG